MPLITGMRGAIRAGARAVSLCALALVAGGLSGCSMLRATVGGYDVGPGGIARPQLRLRDALARGDFPTALRWREEDALLRALTTATSAYYASQFGRAGALLDSAALLADDRMTLSLSREGLALMTNDNARPYQPRRTERLFIAYYGMLSFARLDDWEGAAVEARRVVSLIAQYDTERAGEERALHATMEYLAGAVLERAGRRDEALVAYRVAHAMHPMPSMHRMPSMRGAAAGRPRATIAPDGELVVLLERGFVAHRVSEQVEVYFGGDEHRGHRRRRGGRDGSPSHAHEQADRRRGAPAEPAASQRDSGGGRAHARTAAEQDDHRDGYWMAVAFPALRRTARPWQDRTRILVGAGSGEEVIRLAAVVDDAASADERRDRAATLARAGARAAAKYALTKAVKDQQGETAGRIANAGVALLERADVRSWHLLPQELQLFRIRLPAGSHSLQLAVDDGRGTRSLDLGPVTVQAGRLTLAPVRLWRDPPLHTGSVAVR